MRFESSYESKLWVTSDKLTVHYGSPEGFKGAEQEGHAEYEVEVNAVLAVPAEDEISQEDGWRSYGHGHARVSSDPAGHWFDQVGEEGRGQAPANKEVAHVVDSVSTCEEGLKGNFMNTLQTRVFSGKNWILTLDTSTTMKVVMMEKKPMIGKMSQTFGLLMSRNVSLTASNVFSWNRRKVWDTAGTIIQLFRSLTALDRVYVVKEEHNDERSCDGQANEYDAQDVDLEGDEMESKFDQEHR